MKKSLKIYTIRDDKVLTIFLYTRFFMPFFIFILQIGYFLTQSNCWADLSEETVYLTWQGKPSTTMTIQWISSVRDQPSFVTYRQQKSLSDWSSQIGESFSLPQMSHVRLHRVEIKNLQADTPYLFKIANSVKLYQFLTAPSKLEKELHFVVGGDMYHDGILLMAQMCRQAAQTNPTFALLGGDIAYAVKSLHLPNQKMERWIDWIKTWHSNMITPQGNMVPVLSAIGNHDLVGQYDQTPAQATVFSLLFPMPGERIYNVLDFDSYLSLFILDSGHANPIKGAQTEWLDKTLQSRQHIQHRIAIYHVPAYPCIRNFQNKQSSLIRHFWVPLFEKWGVQVAFEHHDHAYKRSHPLLKNRIHPQGVVYLGDGGWGVENPRKPRTPKLKFYLAKFASERHFIAAIISPIQQQFKAINDKGQVIDKWSRQLALKDQQMN